MRSAGNFSPEWGYLAPAPSFLRTARVVLVATAIGATAGAGVVLALVDRPAAEGNKASVAAHAIVTSVQAAPVSTVPPTAAAAASPVAPINVTTAVPATVSPAQAQALARPAPPAPQLATQSPPAVPAPSTLSVAPPSPALDAAAEKSGAAMAPAAKPAPGMAALSEAPSATTDATPIDAPDGIMVPPETVPPQKKTTHHVAVRSASDNRPASLGAVLRRLFSVHNTGTSYYPNRGQ